MELLKEIMELAKKDVVVDYIIVDQKLNGNIDGIINGSFPEKTYTISVIETDSYSGNLILAQSFDDLEEGLLWGFATGKAYLKSLK